jgi:hypothetical protein
MSAQERIGEALRRSLPLLPGAARDVVESLLSPESLAIIAASMVFWAGSHLVGIGELVDLLLLAAGGVLLGKSILDVAEDLWAFARLTVNGSSDKDLDEAARHFARAVIVGGVDVITAILLHKSVKQVRMRPSWKPSSPGLIDVGPPPTATRTFFRPRISRPVKLPSGALGQTDWYGNIWVTRGQTMSEQQVTLYHELVHSVLSPKFKLFARLRANLRASGYVRSALLRYLEEALAEGYGQLKVKGFGAAIKAISFPVGNGYVTLSQLAAEGTAFGSITLGGHLFRVYLSKTPPAGMPARADD